MLPVLFGQQSAALLHQSERAEPERGGTTPGVYMLCRCSHLAQYTLDCLAKGCWGVWCVVVWFGVVGCPKICSFLPMPCFTVIVHQIMKSSYLDRSMTSWHHMAAKQMTPLAN